MNHPIKLKFVTYKVCPHCEGMCIDCFDAAIREAEARGEIRGKEQGRIEGLEEAALLTKLDSVLDLVGGSTGHARGTSIKIEKAIRARIEQLNGGG